MADYPGTFAVSARRFIQVASIFVIGVGALGFPNAADASEPGGGGSCYVGGPGTTSCSTSSQGFDCSVSCAAGFYACCTSPAVSATTIHEAASLLLRALPR
jgi:hypothetical protein